MVARLLWEQEAAGSSPASPTSIMTFYQKVFNFTRQIPRGRVASYGQIAAMIGSPRGARAVGWALHTMDNDPALPWHRVINSKGFITTTCETHTADFQAALLKKEGIKVVRQNEMWWVDMKKFQWTPKG